jgi:probable selenium-dependent hydroxylase accessory protein YqeC
MWHFQRIDLFPLVSGKRFVSFVGAGGKTSLAEHLAANALGRGLKAVITTTTKIYAKEPFVLLERDGFEGLAGTPFVRVGWSLDGGKLTGIDSEAIRRMGEIFDVVLIEADGAKGKPLKYPALHEPVIPDVPQTVVVVAGLDALFEKAGDVVFRPELLAEYEGVHGDEVVTPSLFARFFSGDILLKGVGSRPCVTVLNKYDAVSDKRLVRSVARDVLGGTARPVVIASARHGVFYLVKDETFETV